MRIVFRLLFSSLIFALGWALFRQVLPASAAVAVAIILALAEQFAPAVIRTGTNSGMGGGLRLFVRLGATLMTWPLAVWALSAAGLEDRPARIAIAAAIASAVGVMAAGHGSGRDTMRLWAVTAAVAVPAYALARALVSVPVDPLAVACGCGAVAVALLVARQAIVWPIQHERVLVLAAGAASLAGVLDGALIFILGGLLYRGRPWRNDVKSISFTSSSLKNSVKWRAVTTNTVFSRALSGSPRLLSCCADRGSGCVENCLRTRKYGTTLNLASASMPVSRLSAFESNSTN